MKLKSNVKFDRRELLGSLENTRKIRRGEFSKLKNFLMQIFSFTHNGEDRIVTKQQKS